MFLQYGGRKKRVFRTHLIAVLVFVVSIYIFIVKIHIYLYNSYMY